MTIHASYKKKRAKRRRGGHYETFNSNKIKHISNKIKKCNNILINKEKICNCFDENGLPVKNINNCMNKKNNRNCKDYNQCKKMMKNYMSGYEPNLNPDNWNHPYIKGSHNCYTYFLNDHIKEVAKKCKSLCLKKNKNKCPTKTKKCGDLKPQPGDWAELQGYIKSNRKYTCPDMNYKILADNIEDNKNKYNRYYNNINNLNNTNVNNILHPNDANTLNLNNINISNNLIKDKNNNNQRSVIFPVKFNEKCPPNHYKGALVIDTNKTYHFYRQDNNGRFSHKPGTLGVEQVDASGNPIYAVHLADTDYNKSKRKNGITYDKFCSYYCIPNNNFKSTKAI